jgi:hypothetical protein
MAAGPSIRIGSKDYDVNKDFTWRELLTVEELGGVPLARDGAFESFSVLGAFVFVVLKRDDPTLDVGRVPRPQHQRAHRRHGRRRGRRGEAGGEAAPYQARLTDPRRRWQPWMLDPA